MNIDFLIIGQGLAGSVLAHTLFKRNKSFRVIDIHQEGTASKAAAGIFNPITGREMRKTWMANELFEFLNPFYSELESNLNTRIFFPLPLIRMYHTQQQANDSNIFLEKPGLNEFVDRKTDFSIDGIHDPFGYFSTKKSGYVDVPLLIRAYRKFLIDASLFKSEKFDFEKLKFNRSFCEYEGNTYKMIIFCEGYKAISNPYFKYLPIVPNKGEMLEVSIPELSQNYVFNKNGFLMPRSNRNFWVGATYKRDETDYNISDESETELQDKIRQITVLPFEVINPIIGIRPTVRDRKPLIGVHPKNEQIAIFNGLGSKGVSLAPYWANHFADYLENKCDLSPEVNIDRFYSLF